jgi:hypothetical protein
MDRRGRGHLDCSRGISLVDRVGTPILHGKQAVTNERMRRITPRGTGRAARSGYQAARRGYEELEFPFPRSLVGLEFEAYLASRFDDAAQAGREAEEFFTSVGANSYPARYRNAFRGTPAPPEEPRSAATPRAAVPVDLELPA